jgi:hypothetical protein
MQIFYTFASVDSNCETLNESQYFDLCNTLQEAKQKLFDFVDSEYGGLAFLTKKSEKKVDLLEKKYWQDYYIFEYRLSRRGKFLEITIYDSRSDPDHGEIECVEIEIKYGIIGKHQEGYNYYNERQTEFEIFKMGSNFFKNEIGDDLQIVKIFFEDGAKEHRYELI